MHIVLCWWHLHDEIPCLFRSLAIVDALMLMPIATFLSIITDFNLDHPQKDLIKGPRRRHKILLYDCLS